MEHYAAIDVSLEWGSVCIVDDSGRSVRAAKVRSERAALVGFLAANGLRPLLLPYVGKERCVWPARLAGPPNQD